MGLKVEDRRPVVSQRRPSGRRYELNITEDQWQSIENSEGNSYHVRPQKWETVNEDDDDDDDDDDKDDDDKDDDDDDDDDDDK